MKIVDVSEFYADRGGGVRTYVHQKLRAGAAAGHEVVVVAPGPRDGEERREGGRVIWVQGPPLPVDRRYYLLYRQRRVHEVLTREAPDLVEGSSTWTAGWFAARWPGPAPRVLVLHQDPVAVYPHTLLDRWCAPARIDAACRPVWAYLRRLSARYDAALVAGEWLARRLESFGVSPVHAVPFGIEKARFSPGRRDPAVRRELLARCGLDEEAALLVAVSRHHPEKRLGTLIEAVRLRSRRRKVGLVIYGDGPLRRWVHSRARGVPQVHLAGFVNDRESLATALASADGFLHGSAAETFGLVVAEAICSGLPIVAPDRGGAADLLEPAFAETYRPGDAAGCALAIERLFQRDPAALRAAAARAGRERVGATEDHFDRLFQLYEEIVARSRFNGMRDGTLTSSQRPHSARRAR